MNLDKLKPREKLILVLLGAVIVFSVYMKFVNQIFAKTITSYKTRIKRAELKLNEIQLKSTPVEKQKEKIKSLNTECDRLVEEISELEKMLPSKREASQLIGEFTRLAKEAKLVSIRQKIVTDPKGYDQIFIEVKLNASYPNAIQYIMQIESISPFLRVEEIDISEAAKTRSLEEGSTPVRFVVSSLLGDKSIHQELKANELAKPVVVKRDILASSAKPIKILDEKEYRLEGVTYNASSPTAIINGEVFRIDSEINGMKVKQILPDAVVLTDGRDDHLLKMNR